MFRLFVNVVFCVVLFALVPSTCRAMSDEQKAKVHEMFEKIGGECIGDNPIGEADIANLRGKKAIGMETQCFVACVMKKIGVMNEEGMMVTETALEHVKQVFDDKDELKAVSDFIHTCHAVNSDAVTDGKKGCERAGKAYKCMVDTAAKFGLDF